jgi:predicted phage terminase large subunit-like protein
MTMTMTREQKERIAEAYRVKAMRELLPFIMWTKPGYLAGWFQQVVCEAIDEFLEDVLAHRSPRLMLFAPPRHGKALAVGTPIPTPDGFSNIEELRAGDSVFAVDGSVTKVVAVSKVWRNRKVYKVSSNTGEEVVADAAHEWSVRLDRKLKAWTVRETEWLANRTSPRRPLSPCAEPIKLPVADLPVAPYTLGVWLGDGKNDCGFITQSLEDAVHVLARINDDGFVTRPHANELNTGILGLHVKLRELGVLQNKHIPMCYLRASVEQRTALLQGLIDTDGHVAPDGQTEFCNTNKELAENVLELVHTLGVKASFIHGRATLCGKDCGPKYRVMFYMKDAASLPRKAIRCKDGVKTPGHYLSFEDAGTANTVCIEVAHESHLFLAGRGFLPTHNSEIVSRSMPAFAFGKNPDLSIIATSYSNDLASTMNRDVQRRIDTPEYHQLFPDTTLSRSSVRTVTAAGAFMRNSDTFEIVDHTGLYKSAGVQTGISGRGFDIGIIDDPVKDAQEAGSQTIRDSVWAWYLSTFFTRCMPGAGILVIMCMTGDTRVLMADGTETPLRGVRVGDSIATYENGALTTSTVRNWKNQGIDNVFAIRMTSGKIVKANERHPFLVCRNGELEWKRLKDLKIGEKLVAVATNAGGGANGAASSALSMGVNPRFPAKDSASTITTKRGGLMDTVAAPTKRSVRHISGIGMELCQSTTLLCSNNKEANAPCAASHPPAKTRALAQDSISALITTTKPVRSGGCSATIATSPLAEYAHQKISAPLPHTCDFTEDEIVSIETAGREDVFDIEVDRTHNFIANGLTVSNTRWHADDLAGRLLAQMERGGGGEQWKVLRFPAIAETNEQYRKKGEPLHPERYSLEMLNSIRKGTSDAKGAKAGVGSQVWASLYQQRPSLVEGNIFKEGNWKYLRAPMPPSQMGFKERRHYLRELGITRIIQRWDTALGAKKQADFSACVTLGIAPSRFYILDVWKKQIEFPEVKRQVQLLYDKWLPAKVYIEGGGSASGKATVQAMRRDARVPIYETVTAIDKVLRANAISPQQESGFCYLFEGESWTADFVQMCSAFPNIAHDDDVDAFIGAMEEAVGRKGPMNIPDELLRSEGVLS